MFDNITTAALPDDQNGDRRVVPSQASLPAMAREAVEARSMVEAAKLYPRNTSTVFAELTRSSQRVRFAEKARYRFKRGRDFITGPAIGLAREAARCWGNMTYGLRIVDEDDERVHIQGWAWDMQTNVRTSAEDKFKKLIQRKNKVTGEVFWTEPDERDLRELITRRGALCTRNAILQIIPRDLVDEALDACAETLRKDSAGQLEKSPADAVRAVVSAFEKFSVDVEMLEGLLGYELAKIDADGLTELRAIYRSMKDGNSKRGDHFEVAESSAADDLNAELGLDDSVADTETGEVPEVTFKKCPKCEGKAQDAKGKDCTKCGGLGEIVA